MLVATFTAAYAQEGTSHQSRQAETLGTFPGTGDPTDQKSRGRQKKLLAIPAANQGRE